MIKKSYNWGLTRAKALWSDSLHRNSLYLMMSTGILSAVGFFFWLIASRVYSPEQVGISGSLISMGSLLIAVSVLGFPETLIRFLSNSSSINEKVSTALTLTTLMSILSTLIFLLVVKFWLHQLHDIVKSPWLILLFVFFIVVGVWQKVFQSVFIAKQNTKWIMLESIISSTSKLALVVPLAFLGGFGIFSSFYFGIAIAIFVLFFILTNAYKLKITVGLQKSALNEVSKYSLANHFANTIGLLPTLLLPTVVTKQLGPVEAAYFFLAQMMTNLLLIVPQASSQTLLAHASSKKVSLRDVFARSYKLQALLLGVGIFSFWILGEHILAFFGKNYSISSYQTLKLLALSVIPTSLSILFATRLRVLKKMKRLIYLSALSSSMILVFSILGSRFDLQGVVIGYGIGQIFSSLAFLIDQRMS